MPVLNVRLTLDELILFKERADAMHTNVSEMVRRLVLAEAVPVGRRRHAISGDAASAATREPDPLARTRRYRPTHLSQGRGAGQDEGGPG